ncbi:MAG: PorP/SprF family type IX secretion system membrane protein [Crocinitomicaceae bacterium]
MILIRYIFVLLVSLSSSFGFAQQEQLFQHNYINPFVYNPGYAGINNLSEIAAFRNQKWAEFDGGIISNLITFHSRINQSNSSIGIQLNTDNLGLSNRTKAHVSYAYRLQISEDLIIQPGFSFGIIDQRINYSAIKGDLNDPILTQAFLANKTGIDANFGIFLKYKDFNFGASMPQLIGNKLALNENESVKYQLGRQYILNSSYTFNFKNSENFFIKPDLLLIHTPNLPFHYSATLLTGLKNIGWIGATYKSDYAIGANIGISIFNHLKLGFAYDIPLADMATITNRNNFEIALLYTFGNQKSAPKESKSSKETLENRLKAVVRQQEVKDSIYSLTIDSLNTELNIKQLENKVLEDENILIKDDHLTLVSDTINKNNDDKNDGKNIKVQQEQPIRYPVEDVQTQSIKIKDDYFTEVLDKSEAPDGYYVVTGMYNSKDEAEKLLRIAKTEFDTPKLLVNQRNQKYYVVLYYSENINGVIEALIVSNNMKASGFSKAWALNYFKRQ